MSTPTKREKLRVLIVDDERPARQKLRRMIAADPEVEAIYEAADGLKAVEILRAESPDVAFLDVQMPGASGLDVLEALAPEERPLVVFVTAFDQYAVRAFDAHAVDYILKPFDAERFDRAFQRVKETLAHRTDRAERQRLERALREVQTARPAPLDRLLVDAEDRVLLLPLAAVERFESSRNYVVVHAGAKTFRLRATIDSLEQRLDPRVFVRIHRSTIVRADHVVALEPWSHGDYVVALKSGARARLGRKYRGRLDQFTP